MCWGSVVGAHRLSYSAALWDLSRARDRTHVPCIGRWILTHLATREVLMLFSDAAFFQLTSESSGSLCPDHPSFAELGGPPWCPVCLLVL